MLAHERSSDRWGLDELYPFASGVLLALSLPPFHLSFLALVALVPLFLYLDHPVTVKRIVRAGVITAVVYFGINLNWLIVVGRFSWLIYPGYATILFIYTCNFFVFVLTVVIAKVYLSIDFLYTAPFAWVISERLRAYGDMAFPWSTFGYSLTSFPFFLQFADLVGIYGVSFVLVLLNVLLFHSLKDRRYIVAWLLTQRAIESGEIAGRDGRRPERRLGHAQETDPAVLATLPPSAQRLIGATSDLYARVKRLDDGGLESDAPQSPARALMGRLERGLGGQSG